ncbi:MAG: MafI family immunity protein [Desulfamplus sp.]|nr:MafI family immunity protein [Desulfamplus sp.]
MTTTHFEKIHTIIMQLISFLKGKLPEQDIVNAIEMLENDEFGEAFEILCTQTYEYDVKVDKQFFVKVVEAAEMMKIGKDSWGFIEEQVV